MLKSKIKLTKESALALERLSKLPNINFDKAGNFLIIIGATAAQLASQPDKEILKVYKMWRNDPNIKMVSTMLNNYKKELDAKKN